MLPSTSVSVASRRLDFPKALAADWHCSRRSAYALLAKLRFTFELVMMTAISGSLNGIAVSCIDLKIEVDHINVRA
jgi:hypothetical protein